MGCQAKVLQCCVVLDEGLVGFGEGEFVADVGAADPEDDVFCDVGGVVGGTLEVSGDDDGVEGLTAEFRLPLHGFDEFSLNGSVHVVYLVVQFEDVFGEFSVCLEERLDGGADHDSDFFSHVGDVEGQRDGRHVLHGAGALGDVGCLVADAFEITVDLDDGEDEAEIDGHGLLFGEEVVGHLVDGGFGCVDGVLDLEDVLAEAEVGGDVGFEREAQSLLREGCHSEEFVFESDELLLEVNAGHGSGSLLKLIRIL